MPSKQAIKQVLNVKFFYPISYAVLPVLFLYNTWSSENLPLANLVAPVTLCILSSLFIQAISLALTKSAEKSALITWLIITGFYSVTYALMIDQALSAGFKFQLPAQAIVAITTFILLFTVIILLAMGKRQGWPLKLNTPLRQIGIFLITLQLLVAGYNEALLTFLYKPAVNEAQNKILNSIHLADFQPASVAKKRPDVYLIITDEMGSGNVLKKVFAYDNKDFLDALTKRGFNVMSGSHSNYPMTKLSLSSLMNMSYLDFAEKIVSKDIQNFGVSVELMQNSVVMQLMQKLGYKYIALASEFPPIINTPQAQFNGKPILEEFTIKSIQYTLAYSLPGVRSYLDESKRQSRLQTLRYLETIPQSIEGPRFVVCHLLCPHAPFLFRADGSPRDSYKPLRVDGAWTEEGKAGYIDQVKFIQNQVLAAIDKILLNSKERPIIILQGDHGPCAQDDMDKEFPRDSLYVERFGILNAYLVPETIKSRLYDSITPVNSFRLILSDLTDQTIPLLEDKCIYSCYPAPFRSHDVTRKIIKDESTTFDTKTSKNISTKSINKIDEKFGDKIDVKLQ